jgi:hypothetical protein
MSIKERIDFFNFIKNIPYQIGLTRSEPMYTCATKASMLEKLLNNLNIQCRQMLCSFDWNETPLPADILALLNNGNAIHQYLQVLIPESGAWVNIDPTWDDGLAELGFPIANWDGLHNTQLAVKPHEIFSSEKAQALFSSFTDANRVDQHFEKYKKFYNAINVCFANARMQQGMRVHI